MLDRAHQDARPGTGQPDLEGAWRSAATDMRRAGLPTPELDARLLLEHACDIDHETLVGEPGRALTQSESRRYKDLIQRRLAREPVARIVGRRGFWKYDFAINPETLDPRPDTECVVEAALSIAARNGGQDKLWTILDAGTGSGCILLSLLGELPRANGIGTDLSAGAIAAARTNSETLGLADRTTFVRASWLDAIAGPIDLLVANPPYIRSGDIEDLAPEVAHHDPRRALDGGEDGFDAFRAIIGRLPDILRPGGWVLFEIGDGQLPELRGLLEQAGYEFTVGCFHEFADLTGQMRCVAVMQR